MLLYYLNSGFYLFWFIFSCSKNEQILLSQLAVKVWSHFQKSHTSLSTVLVGNFLEQDKGIEFFVDIKNHQKQQVACDGLFERCAIIQMV